MGRQDHQKRKGKRDAPPQGPWGFKRIDALLQGTGNERRQKRQEKKQDVDKGESVCLMIHKNKRGIIIDPPAVTVS
jgi:hypothetical protein